MRATSIKWDVDNEEELELLPSEMEIPEEIKNDEDAISDYLSDATGFCHDGFVLEN